MRAYRTRSLSTVIVLLLATASRGQAPSADWRTVTTPHFRVHYPRPYEAWSLRAASRLESVRDAVVREVGFAPAQVTDVVVENPVADANGLTLSLLDTPRIVLFTEPPGPDLEIGDYSDWIDLLTVHEMTHLVHLLRPSRSRMQQALARLLPLDPIALDAPRWVIEGYATVVEGRLTGSGRPTSSIRAAILRRWAEAGRLPSYDQLDSNRSFLGMSMAYLVGSAYLEWLEERGGPGSLRNLWARMTARQKRSFRQSFEGVFGDQPDRLYGRFVAELTERAMVIERGPAPREGELWQETARRSGDPAVSPDGKRIALVVRPLDKPARIVVWSTEAPLEEEKKRQERIAGILRRDPEDVAPVRSGPLSRKQLYSFCAPDGGDIETPRWTADGRSLIYSHRQPDGDGFLHRDLFRWTPERGTNERLTHLADVSDADPLPDGSAAIAVRDRFGYSQLVRVNFASGEAAPLTEPSLDRVDTHPRVSADGRRVVVACHDRSAWRLVVRDLATGEERAIDFQPRTNVAMPEWSRTDPGEIYATVLSGGFIDLHRFGPDGSNVAITRTSGAAFSPAPSPDGRIFFMALERDGYVVRVIHPEEPAPPPPPFEQALVPAVPPQPSGALAFGTGPLSTPRPYGIGRQEAAWIVGGTYATAGRTTEVGIRFGDVVGRLDTIAVAAMGEGTSPHGVAVASAWRGWPIAIAAHAFSARGTDAPEHGIELRGSWEAHAPLNVFRVEAGVLAGSLRRGFIESAVDMHQFQNSIRFEEGLAVEADGAGGASHFRGTGRVAVRLGSLHLRARVQRDAASNPRDDFDRIAVGGFATTITPASALATRVLDPALDSRSLIGNRYEGLRIEASSGALTGFWQQHRVAGDRLSLAGLELAASSEAIPLIKAPAFEVTLGVARLLDAHQTRAWLGVRWHP